MPSILLASPCSAHKVCTRLHCPHTVNVEAVNNLEHPCRQQDFWLHHIRSSALQMTFHKPTRFQAPEACVGATTSHK